jgi:type II secretory pathway pseudopilin PulG
MTLVEMLIALAVFSVVIAGALGFLRSQSKGFQLGSQRAATLQNLRYVANTLDLDLRTLGSNVPDGQPFMVYAGSSVLAYNTDYTTNIPGNPYAVYYDRDATDAAVMALEKATRIVIPTTGYAYPDTNYLGMGGVENSPAETVVFYFALDSSTSRADDYVLMRKVNGLAAELVAHNILKTSGQDFFRYYRLKSPLNAPAYVEVVPSGSIPMWHSIKIHGSPADTGASARVDSLRAAELNFTVTNGLTGADERKLSITRTIRFPNAGMAVKRSCGDAPILGTALSAADTTIAGATIPRLRWTPAVDETGGEKDVQLYVVWRRIQGDPDWGVPYLSLPAGQDKYLYIDADVTSGTTYEYALAAQDCTPTSSSQAISAPAAVP